MPGTRKDLERSALMMGKIKNPQAGFGIVGEEEKAEKKGASMKDKKSSNVKSNKLMPTKKANTYRTKYIAREAGLDNITHTRDAMNLRNAASKAKKKRASMKNRNISEV